MAGQITGTGLSGGDGVQPKSELEELVKSIKSNSAVEEELGYMTTTEKLMASNLKKAPKDMSPEYASELAKQLGQSLYVFDLSHKSLYILHEKGIDFERDAERNCPLLYNVAKRTFSQKMDLTGYA